jgi:hypothetical protein
LHGFALSISAQRTRALTVPEPNVALLLEWVSCLPTALGCQLCNDNKKAKADPAPKSEAAAKDKSTAGEAVSKTKGGEAAAAPSNYSCGEGQKPVTTAYKENWNAIYAKKKKR